MKKAVYIAIGIDLDGHKDVLGMWVGENESAKYRATVLNSLRNRGIEDILSPVRTICVAFLRQLRQFFLRLRFKTVLFIRLEIPANMYLTRI